MKKTLTGLMLLTLFFLLLLYPEEVKSAALDGLFLWYNSVVPILLPFLILSNLIIGTDSLSVFLHPLSSIQKYHSGFPSALFYPIFLGLFCGFPMGAKISADLIHSHAITPKQGSLLLPVVNQASPMFLAGFVGVHILKNTLSFPKMLFYLYLPPFLFLLIRMILQPSKFRASTDFGSLSAQIPDSPKGSFRDCKQSPRSHASMDFGSLSAQKNSMSPNLEHTIWNSFHVIVTIGIYMMLFTIASRLCMKLLPQNQHLSILLCSLEFSTGLNQLAALNLASSIVKTGLILALTSFGGFCTAAQTSALIKDTGISMKAYLFWKFLIASGVFLLYSSSSSSS